MKDKISLRQEEIIAAAAQILTESGVHGLTTKNLAFRMKFSESAIYRHFKSKEEIIWLMLQQLGQSMDKRISAAVAAEPSADKKLKSLFESQLNFFSVHSHFVVAVFSEGLMGESKMINESVKNIMSINAKHITAIIEEGQQAGIFTRSIPAGDMVHIVMGSFRLHMMKWRMQGFVPDLKETGKRMLHSVITLIKDNK